MTHSHINQIREQFPNLNVKVHGQPLVYLDNAATTLKPQRVIDAVEKHYTSYTSNVHRGVHTLSEQATAQYEGGRVKLQKLINAAESAEIILTTPSSRNAEGI